MIRSPITKPKIEMITTPNSSGAEILSRLIPLANNATSSFALLSAVSVKITPNKQATGKSVAMISGKEYR
ncbi:hypothetical protein D3C87_1716850 [compost metagenome]